MDNIETTDIQKKNKIGILDIIFFVISGTILGLFIYLIFVGGALFLFGYMWYVNCILIFFQMVMFIYFFISWIGQPKSKKRTKCIIACAVMFALEAGVIVWAVYEDVKNIVDTEQITLSDGNEILLEERITHDKIDETRFEITYISVYQIKGIAAKELGGINETYFSNKCLLQDKYTYEYDETSKKLTVICEHGSASLEEQNGTGFWEREFILE